MGITAFVCAMPMEMRALAKRIDLKKETVSGLEVRTGTLDGEPVVGYVTGMGPDLATTGIDELLAAVRPERVVEVRYDHMEGEGFRHTVQFNRWRPDRDPRSCTYEQLEQPVTFNLGDIVPGLGTSTSP